MTLFSKKNILCVALFILYIVPIFFTHAAAPVAYKLLVSDLPGLGSSVTPGAGGGVAGYLNTIFKIGLGIAVTLAILMFVYNGVIYMMSDVVGKKEEAKKAFYSIIGGLILVFGSVIILNTINPQLINFGLFDRLNTITAPAGGTGGTGVTPPTSGGNGTTDPVQEANVRNSLLPGITVNHDACPAGQTQGCTNVGDLPPSAISRLQELQRVGGDLIINGGTEGGHTTHGPGQPVVDLAHSMQLDAFLKSQEDKGEASVGGHVYKWGDSYFWDEPTGTGPHWHSCLGIKCRINGVSL
ncbi:hypothetical protein IPJ70_03090 [Candidatus Campbellbacteria bacterium]|nr:MAG: hypothetical protein IPJ70_03090 [Candidatus Campbellbacteria bacterium]